MNQNKNEKAPPNCPHCEDEGFIIVPSKDGKESTMYRCSYCKLGLESPIDIPLFPRKKNGKNGDNGFGKSSNI